MGEIIKNERPKWCPHPDCIFQMQEQNLICGGKLPKPAPHGEVKEANDKRICIDTRETGHGIFDLQVNDSDLEAFRFIFDSLDGKVTSWRMRGHLKYKD